MFLEVVCNARLHFASHWVSYFLEVLLLVTMVLSIGGLNMNLLEFTCSCIFNLDRAITRYETLGLV